MRLSSRLVSRTWEFQKPPRLDLPMHCKTGPERTRLIFLAWWSAPPAKSNTSARGKNGTRCMLNLKTTRPMASLCSACIQSGRSRSRERPTQDWTISPQWSMLLEELFRWNSPTPVLRYRGGFTNGRPNWTNFPPRRPPQIGQCLCWAISTKLHLDQVGVSC